MAYGFSLFGIPGMQCVVYSLKYKVFAATSYCLLLNVMSRIKLLRALQLIFQMNKTVRSVSRMQCAFYTPEYKDFDLVFPATTDRSLQLLITMHSAHC